MTVLRRRSLQKWEAIFKGVKEETKVTFGGESKKMLKNKKPCTQPKGRSNVL